MKHRQYFLAATGLFLLPLTAFAEPKPDAKSYPASLIDDAGMTGGKKEFSPYANRNFPKSAGPDVAVAASVLWIADWIPIFAGVSSRLLESNRITSSRRDSCCNRCLSPWRALSNRTTPLLSDTDILRLSSRTMTRDCGASPGSEFQCVTTGRAKQSASKTGIRHRTSNNNKF